MNTDIKHIAAIAATAIWADGEYDEAEKIVLEEVAEALELDANTLTAEVDAALAEIVARNGGLWCAEAEKYLLENAPKA